MTAFPDLRVSMDDLTSDGGRTLYSLDPGRARTPGRAERDAPCASAASSSGGSAAEGLIEESLGHFDAADYQRQLDGRP